MEALMHFVTMYLICMGIFIGVMAAVVLVKEYRIGMMFGELKKVLESYGYYREAS